MGIRFKSRYNKGELETVRQYVARQRAGRRNWWTRLADIGSNSEPRRWEVLPTMRDTQ